jgi:molybdopterin-guanine dinucleotide biosynthesis protein A
VSHPGSREPTIVAVLAGGAGSRLGQSKPLAPLGGVPLLDRAVAAAREAELPAIVVAKRGTTLPALSVGLVLEPDEPTHPLLGIVSALRFAAGADIVSLPCDMPFVPASLLAFLASLDGTATVAGGGQAQPLLSRVSASARPELERALERGDSAQSAIGALGPQLVDEAELARFGDPPRMLFNINTPADLLRAQEWTTD